MRNENVCASPMRNQQTAWHSEIVFQNQKTPQHVKGDRLGCRLRRQCRIGANRLRPLYEVFQQTFLQKAFQSRLKIVTVFQLSPMYVLLVPLQALPSGSDKTETNKHIKNKAPNRPQEANRIAHHYMNRTTPFKAARERLDGKNNGNYRRHSSFGQFPHLFSIKRIRKITTGTHARKDTEKRTDPNFTEYTAAKDPG